MSDYISGLRGDLVDAAARHQRRGSLARTALPALPRAWSRPALAAVLATAACLAAIAIAVSTVGPPTPAPAQPHRLAVVRLGVDGFDATYATGFLWVAGENGEVVVVDTEHNRVANRLKLGELGGGIAADGGSVWASAIEAGHGNITSSLVQIDARTSAIKRRLPRHAREHGALATGAGGVWVVPDTSQNGNRIERYDPATGRRVALIRGDFTNDLAVGDGVLWALGGTGDLAQIDPASNRITAVVRAVTQPSGLNNGATGMSLAADGSAVWVAGGTRGDVVMVQAGQIVRRIRVGEDSVDGVARTRDALWVTLATGAPNARYRVLRIDPETGRPTGTLNLGHRQPMALAPAGRGLWILTLGGSATLIR
jgi:hypothetical protein